MSAAYTVDRVGNIRITDLIYLVGGCAVLLLMLKPLASFVRLILLETRSKTNNTAVIPTPPFFEKRPKAPNQFQVAAKSILSTKRGELGIAESDKTNLTNLDSANLPLVREEIVIKDPTLGVVSLPELRH